MSEMNNNTRNTTTEQPRDARGRFTRRSPEPLPESEIMEDFDITEDFPEIEEVNVEQEAPVEPDEIFIADEENSGNGGDNHNADVESNADGRSNWLVILLIILVIGLAGHLVWCLVHHINQPVTNQVTMCTACKKLESECECIEIRSDLVKQIASLQAQIDEKTPSTTPVEVRVEICKICGKEEGCNCAEQYAAFKDELDTLYQMVRSDKCYGLCTVHCNHEQPTSKPTAKPAATPTAKPAATPTAKPTSKPTAKPTTAPTAKPTTAPTTKPTTAPTAKPTTAPTTKPTTAPTTKPTTAPTEAPCTHPTTVESKGEVKWSGDNWTQEVREICVDCGKIAKAWTDSGVCEHEKITVVEGEKQAFTEYDWIQEIREVCDTCGVTVDTYYHGGIYEDVAIPSNPNSWEYDDEGEAAKPVS